MEIDEALDIVVGRTGHERFRQLCDPTHADSNPAYVPLVIALAEGRDVAPAPAHVGQAEASSLPDIPLAGDLIEAIARRIGAHRLAALWERWTGRPCGCAGRRERLNRATEVLVKWMARTGSHQTPLPASLTFPRLEGFGHPEEEPDGEEEAHRDQAEEDPPSRREG